MCRIPVPAKPETDMCIAQATPEAEKLLSEDHGRAYNPLVIVPISLSDGERTPEYRIQMPCFEYLLLEAPQRRQK